MTTCSRRDFWGLFAWRVLRWLPWVSLTGLRFREYTFGPAAGYVGWIEWCGKVVYFVPVK